MLAILGMMSTAVTGGVLASLMDSPTGTPVDRYDDESQEPLDATRSEDSLNLFADDLGGDPEGTPKDSVAVQDHTLVQPNGDGPDAWFDDFTPGRDTLVVTYADGAAAPTFDDLDFIYDDEFDETEVTLNTGDGCRVVCFLPGVMPADVTPEMVDFMPHSEAGALFAD